MIGLDNTRQLLGVKHGEAEGEVSQKTIEMAKELLRNGTSFVMNCTNTHKLSREKWIKLFDDYDFATKIHYVERPLSKILNQNKNREAVVPEEYILKKLKRIDMPLKTECHEIQYDA